MTNLIPRRLPKEKVTVETIPLTARQIYGNLVFTGANVTAWHKASLVQWPFMPDAERKHWMLTAAAQYAQLVGHRVYERVTTRPYPIADWARALDSRTPHPADLPDDESWADYLLRQQRLMHGMQMAEKEVYIGVQFSARDNFARLVERFGLGTAVERDRIGREAERIAAILRGQALNARPLRGEETAWLMHRSISLGLPVPYDRDTTGTEAWEDDDLAALTDGVFYKDSRFGRTVEITSRRADQVHSRNVAVVTYGQMTGVSAPETGRSEWLHALDRLPFPVERLSYFDVVGPEQTRKHVKGTLLAIRDQQKHYRQHELDVPDDLARKGELAKRIDSELSENLPAYATRFVGFHRIAVSGTDEEEAMQRVRQIQDLYRNRIAMHLPPAQGPLLREFIPGEPPQRATHLRRFNALFYTAGAGLATGDVGDRTGTWIDTLDGAVSKPVLFDPWLAPETLDSPGMYPVIGTLGSGKSTLIGKLTDAALRRGVPTVVFDPSFTFAGLALMPRWKRFSRVIDLHDAPAGVLNPFSLVQPPIQSDFASEELFEDGMKIARGERRQLVIDVCNRLLTPTARRHPDTDRLLREAIREADTKGPASLWDVIDILRDYNAKGEQQANVIAGALEDINEMSREGKLFFPDRGTDPSMLPIGRDLLTVITIGGLQLPPARDGRGEDEENWTIAERVAVPALMLATLFATRMIYSTATRSARKLLVLDEMHVLGEWSSGRALFNRLARDSRKWNVAVFAAGQNPTDALNLNVQNLIGGAFVGRINDDQTATEALRLLRIETGINYEEVVRKLSPPEYRDTFRQFLMLDATGRVGLISVTFDDDPELLRALNTRPGERR